MTATPSSTRKKVVVRRLDKELIKGYVNPASFLGEAGVELLDREGRVGAIPLNAIKAVYFVRDFEGDPDYVERKAFLRRPKLDGLWVRLTFKDEEVFEGILANNLLTLDARGFLVTPADFSSNNLRIFVPRSALSGMEVLAAITNGAARRAPARTASARRKAEAANSQIGLFPSPPTADSK
ncbi:MAG: hypothetical protein HYS61_09790 [Acidobacteria bacterium]|nr:hypothetical protein [Acidobacteriota bacterium]